MAAERTNRAGASPCLQSKGIGQEESTGCRKKCVCVFGEVFSRSSWDFWLPAVKEMSLKASPADTHPVCQARMWWGLPGGVAASSLDGVELLWL